MNKKFIKFVIKILKVIFVVPLLVYSSQFKCDIDKIVDDEE